MLGFACSQNCFICTHIYIKSTWHLHYLTEESAREREQENGETTDISEYNPWPGYLFTGNLRPAPVVSSHYLHYLSDLLVIFNGH